MLMRPVILRLVCLSTSLFLFATPALAERTYTPAQLRAMVDSGNPPKQGSPTTKSESMDYASCIAKISGLVSSVGSNYPTMTVASTSVMKTVKLWTNDAAMTVTCSASDRKMLITVAKYL